jgi:hypothetical protein
MSGNRCELGWIVVMCLAYTSSCFGQTPMVSPATPERCEVLPLEDQQVAFAIDGVEKLRWHFGSNYPRPYFYPLLGPSGAVLTRMGHPGAPDHDHHQSIWFAHNKLNGLDFWGNGKGTSIRQKQWLCYQDGPTEAVMAVLLGWYDSQGAEMLEQELIVAILPVDIAGAGAPPEHALELQFTLKPGADVESVELEQTNFGWLAVRVAKGISAHFGSGQLTNSHGAQGESACFGQSAAWMDYSGSVTVGQRAERKSLVEGITFFDHPSNPRYPTHWHVRQDGWMGASYGLVEAAQITESNPLTLRYLLHAHSGNYDPAKAQGVAQQFAARSAFELLKRPQPHLSFSAQRRAASSE